MVFALVPGLGLATRARRLLGACWAVSGIVCSLTIATGDVVTPKLASDAGLCDRPLDLNLPVEPGTRVVFTTNGSIPTPESAATWPGHLQIRSTTLLRWRALGDHGQLGATQTRSFLYPRDVLNQRGAGCPISWGTTNGEPVRAAYALSGAIVNDPQYRDTIEPALRALPTIAITLDPADLFDADRGIYSHSQESGPNWERPASVEWIPETGRGFQIDCGLRVQGGWNRRPEESPKHAFRLVFNRRYGTGPLRYPLFGGDGIDEFETLILRAGCNNTWLHWSGEERKRGDYIRDQWMRETLAAMGHPSARGRFAHLYLNGLYWGIYNLTERPSAPFVAAHLGGRAKDYDCRNGDHVLEGTDTAWQNLMRLSKKDLSKRRHYEAITNLVDLPQFIDYMLANLYGANADWDRSSNWYAARRRQPAGPFQFYIWDGERTLEAVDANTIDFDDDQSPPGLFQRLRASDEFRLAFADHVQRHLFGAGVLASERAAARYRAWADRLDPAIVAESARWGAYRRDVHPYKTGPFERYTRDEFWRPEIKRLLTDYFLKRPAELLKQFRAAGLYPAIDPPRLEGNGDEVAMDAPAGIIYFTTDGSDPRLPGGEISNQAQRYQAPIVRGGAAIKARVGPAQSPDRRAWSALVEF